MAREEGPQRTQRGRLPPGGIGNNGGGGDPLADRLVAADKDFELLIVPGAEHMFIDHLAYVRKCCWDFLVRELMGTQPPTYRPAPIAIGPELVSELFAYRFSGSGRSHRRR